MCIKSQVSQVTQKRFKKCLGGVKHCRTQLINRNSPNAQTSKIFKKFVQHATNLQLYIKMLIKEYE